MDWSWFHTFVPTRPHSDRFVGSSGMCWMGGESQSSEMTRSSSLRNPDHFEIGGRGLVLVAKVADARGTRPEPDGKTIWAELAL